MAPCSVMVANSRCLGPPTEVPTQFTNALFIRANNNMETSVSVQEYVFSALGVEEYCLRAHESIIQHGRFSVIKYLCHGISHSGYCGDSTEIQVIGIERAKMDR